MGLERIWGSGGYSDCIADEIEEYLYIDIRNAYKNNDRSHGVDHFTDTYRSMEEMIKCSLYSQYHDIEYGFGYMSCMIAAAYHDIGRDKDIKTGNTEIHAIEILRNDKKLRNLIRNEFDADTRRRKPLYNFKGRVDRRRKVIERFDPLVDKIIEDAVLMITECRNKINTNYQPSLVLMDANDSSKRNIDRLVDNTIFYIIDVLGIDDVDIIADKAYNYLKESGTKFIPKSRAGKEKYSIVEYDIDNLSKYHHPEYSIAYRADLILRNKHKVYFKALEEGY